MEFAIKAARGEDLGDDVTIDVAKDRSPTARSSSPRTTRRASPPSGRSNLTPNAATRPVANLVRPGRRAAGRRATRRQAVRRGDRARRRERGRRAGLDPRSRRRERGREVDAGQDHRRRGGAGRRSGPRRRSCRSATARHATQSETASRSSTRSSRSRPRCRCSTTCSWGSSAVRSASSTAPSSATCSPGRGAESASTTTPSVRAGTLRVADQQMVEIIRALVRDARLIVMDEPTAALPRNEAERLLELTRELRAEGTTIIYLSHILGDVLDAVRHVTVLKDGRHVRTVADRGRDHRRAGDRDAGSLSSISSSRRASRSTANAPVVLSVRGPVGSAEVRRRLVRHQARRDRGPRRARRQRPHRDRPRPVRRRSCIWDNPHEWSAGAIPLAEGSHPRRHGAAAREPQGPGPRDGTAGQREREHGPHGRGRDRPGCSVVTVSAASSAR